MSPTDVKANLIESLIGCRSEFAAKYLSSRFGDKLDQATEADKEAASTKAKESILYFCHRWAKQFGFEFDVNKVGSNLIEHQILADVLKEFYQSWWPPIDQSEGPACLLDNFRKGVTEPFEENEVALSSTTIAESKYKAPTTYVWPSVNQEKLDLLVTIVKDHEGWTAAKLADMIVDCPNAKEITGKFRQLCNEGKLVEQEHPTKKNKRGEPWRNLYLPDPLAGLSIRQLWACPENKNGLRIPKSTIHHRLTKLGMSPTAAISTAQNKSHKGQSIRRSKKTRISENHTKS